MTSNLFMVMELQELRIVAHVAFTKGGSKITTGTVTADVNDQLGALAPPQCITCFKGTIHHQMTAYEVNMKRWFPSGSTMASRGFWFLRSLVVGLRGLPLIQEMPCFLLFCF